MLIAALVVGTLAVAGFGRYAVKLSPQDGEVQAIGAEIPEKNRHAAQTALK